MDVSTSRVRRKRLASEFPGGFPLVFWFNYGLSCENRGRERKWKFLYWRWCSMEHDCKYIKSNKHVTSPCVNGYGRVHVVLERQSSSRNMYP